MANAEAIRAIDLRRLAELEMQRAYKGIDTEPAVLIEIADLRAKYGSDAVAVSKETGPEMRASVSNFADEIDFLRTITSVLLREVDLMKHQRLHDVLWRNIWLAALTLAVILVLVRVY